MRIDHLTITNFNGFEHRTFGFNPRFNLRFISLLWNATRLLFDGTIQESRQDRSGEKKLRLKFAPRRLRSY